LALEVGNAQRAAQHGTAKLVVAWRRGLGVAIGRKASVGGGGAGQREFVGRGYCGPCPRLDRQANRLFSGFSLHYTLATVVAIPDGDSKGQEDVESFVVGVPVQSGGEVALAAETEPVAPGRGPAGGVQLGSGDVSPSSADLTGEEVVG
jgi:hypothetical protein